MEAEKERFTIEDKLNCKVEAEKEQRLKEVSSYLSNITNEHQERAEKHQESASISKESQNKIKSEFQEKINSLVEILEGRPIEGNSNEVVTEEKV